MVVILSTVATDEDVDQAKLEYKTYIKVTMDVEKEIVAIGGEYHFDAEQELLKVGCTQETIWGGGVDLIAKRIDYNAMINIRAGVNYSTEISDQEVKQKFTSLVKKYLPQYVI
ncbi:MAG: DUF5674 family protein [Patescibacteria group bacterium]